MRDADLLREWEARPLQRMRSQDDKKGSLVIERMTAEEDVTQDVGGLKQCDPFFLLLLLLERMT